MSIALRLYRWLSYTITPLAPYIFRARARKKPPKEDISRLGERLGHTVLPRPEGRLIWLHGASVGECNMLAGLIVQMHEKDRLLHFLITSQTQTSAHMIINRNLPHTYHQYAAVDCPGAVRRFIARWKPDLAIFAESEIWPNMLQDARTSGTKIALINARMTDRSRENWSRFHKSAKRIFTNFDCISAANKETAKFLKDICGKDVFAIGNLKYTIAPPDCDLDELARLQAIINKRPVFAALSTHSGEEEFILSALSKLYKNPQLTNSLLILAPRHPERAGEIIEHVRQHTANTDKIYQWSNERNIPKDAHILLADSIGDMGLWIRLAHAIYLGGAHINGIGGHNPIEIVMLGKPVLSGPFANNFTEEFTMLNSLGAAHIITDETELIAAITPMLLQSNSDTALRLGWIHKIQEKQKIMDQTCNQMFKLIEEV